MTTVITFQFLLGLLGLTTHFLKRKIKGQTVRAIKNYFKGNLKDTIIAVIAFIVSFAILVQTGELSYLSAFLTGYACDSIFNNVGIKDVSSHDDTGR